MHFNKEAQKFIDRHQREFVRRWPREGKVVAGEQRRVRLGRKEMADRWQYAHDIVKAGRQSAEADAMGAATWTEKAVEARLKRVSVPSGAQRLQLPEEEDDDEQEDSACFHACARPVPVPAHHAIACPLQVQCPLRLSPRPVQVPAATGSKTMTSSP